MAQQSSGNIFLEISEIARQTNHPQFNFSLNCVFESIRYGEKYKPFESVIITYFMV